MMEAKASKMEASRAASEGSGKEVLPAAALDWAWAV